MDMIEILQNYVLQMKKKKIIA